MNKEVQHKILKGCLSGEKLAYKQFYDLFSQDMFKVCCMYAPDLDSADDFLQEAFLKVFQNLHKYKPTGSLGGWVRRTVVNNCIDILRRDHWYKLRTSLEGNDVDMATIYEDVSFEQDIESKSFFEITNSLPVGYKTILNLYYLEDYKHKEIAELLGITVGTSKSQLSKAKKYLKEVLLKSLTIEEIENYVGRLVKELV